jgi:hypothetical protein
MTGFQEGHTTPPDEERCRKTNRVGDRCQGWVVPGQTRCIRHPTHRGKQGSARGGVPRAVVTKIKEAIDAAAADPDLLRLEPQIGAYKTRLAELLERIDARDTPEFRQTALNLFSQYSKLMAENAESAATQVWEELGEVLRKGVVRDAAWEKFLTNTDRVAHRIEQALAIRLKAQQVVAHDDLGRIMGRVLDIILEEAPREAVTVIVSRIDSEIMGVLQSAAREAAGLGRVGPVREVQGRSRRLHEGSDGERPVGEAGGDSPRAGQ